MPYTLKTQQIAVKDPDTGAYSGVDILTEQTTEGLLTEIIATGTEVKADVAAQMATERSDFNTYITGKESELNTYIVTKNQEITTMIADADEDVSDLEDRKQDIATAIAGMIDKGVDNTLTTENVPAESKAVGDLFETIVQGKSTQPTDKWNRLWIKPSANDYEIPTMEDIDELKGAVSDPIIPNIDWVVGGITSTGVINSSFKYSIRPGGRAFLCPVNGNIQCEDGYQIRVVKYNVIDMGAGAFVSDSGWTTNPVEVYTGEYIAPQIRYFNDTATVLTDTSISEHIIYKLYAVKIEDGIITRTKLSPALQETLSTMEADVNDTKNAIRQKINLEIDWVIGGITGQGGINSSYKYCIRPNGNASFISANGTIGCDEGYRIRVVKYNNTTMGSGAFVSDSGWNTIPVSVSAGEYIAICIMYGTDTTAVLTDTSISEHIIYNIFDTGFYLNRQAGIGSDYRRATFDTNLHFHDWYSGLNSSYDIATLLGREVTGRDGLTSDIISLYDALVSAFPNYITKTDLGVASGNDFDGQPYHLYEYAFLPIDATYNKHPKTRPTVMLDAGMHGFEKAVVYGLYCFMYDICYNWDKNPSLKAIRQGVNIRIIPVTCPYGFDRNDRLNANHINLNRNFESPNWQAIPATETDGVWDSGASGAAPFDQPETAIIRDWVNRYKKYCLAYLNLHTNGQYNVTSYYEMNACIALDDVDDEYYNRIQTVFRKHICEQTLMWTNEWQNLVPSSTIGRFQNQNSTDAKFGTIQQWLGYIIKQIGICLEGFNGVTNNGIKIIDSMNEQSIKMNSENIGNMVIQFLDEYTRII